MTDVDAQRSGLVGECREVAERTVFVADAVVVGHVVAVVAIRGFVKGLQPHAGHAETREVGQPCGQSLEVADTVAVGVHELLHVQAIDNRVAVPEVLDGHVRCGSKVWAELAAPKSV
jgi:hypothetical protein